MQRSPGVLWRDGEFGVVLLPPGAREPKTLTGSGRQLWRALDRPMSRAELVDELASAFEVDPAQVEADIAPVLAELTGIGALEESPSP